MSYVGRGLYQVGGQYRKLDDISSGFDGSTTSFSLTVSNKSETPSVQNLMISINGVVQEPGSAFTVNGSTIHFTEAPETNSSFFGIVMGEASYIPWNTVGANEMGVNEGAVSASGGVVADSSKNISGFNKVTSTSFSGTFEGALSSSAQIKTNISGSFTDTSSSFSSRVARLETSGSITESSASFSTRVSNLKTDSGSFSTRITAATSSISALKTDSGSFSTRITTNTSTGSILAGSGNIQGLGSTNNVTFSSVTATGNITAQEFHTEFVSSSIIHTSGSTKFGDTQDDIHQFTGSLQLSGSAVNESYIVGTNVGIGTTNPGNASLDVLRTSGTDTAIFQNSSTNGDSYILSKNDAETWRIGIEGSNNDSFNILSDGSTRRLTILNGGNVGIGTNNPAEKLTVAGGSALFSRADSSPAQATTPNTNIDDIIVGSSDTANTGITILSTNQGAIAFGDASAIQQGQIEYQHSTDLLRFSTNGGTVAMSIDASQNVEFPKANAKISGSSTSTGSFGAVGVGTANPETKLQVGGANQGGVGTAFMARGDSGDIARIWSGATGGNRALMVGHLQNGGTSQAVFNVKRGNASNDAFYEEMFVVKTDLSYFKNGNVGIGNTAPPQPLTVAGNISGSGNLDIDGNMTASGDAYFGSNVGIGTGSPSRTLHVSGAFMQSIDSGNGSGAWAASFYNYATDGHGVELGIGNGTSTNSAFEIQNSAENRTFFKVAQNGTSSFDGKVGIGDTSPSAKLEINESVGNTPALIAYHSSGNTSAPVVKLYGDSASNTKEILLVHENATRSNLATPILGVTGTSGNTSLFNVMASGNVGIGTSSPVETLHVEGSASFGGNHILNEQGRQDHTANTMPAPYYHLYGEHTSSIDISALYGSSVDLDNQSIGSVECLFTPTREASMEIVSFGQTTNNSRNRVMYLKNTGTGVNNMYIDLEAANANKYRASGSINIPIGKPVHAVFTHNGTEPEIYVNGVKDTLQYDITTDKTHWFTTAAGAAITNGWNTAFVGAHQSGNDPRGGYFHGDVHRLRFFNNVLSQEEINEIYSGASIPFKYKSATNTEMYTKANAMGDKGGNEANATTGLSNRNSAGTFESSGTSVEAGSYSIHIVSTGNNSGLSGPDQVTNLVVGKRYRVSYQVRVVSGTITSELFTGNSGNHVSPSSHGTADWTTKSFDFIAEGTALGFYQFGTAEWYVDNFSCIQLGAVAEYDSSGMSAAKWYDKSGNDLHGTVSTDGTVATVENASAAPTQQQVAFLATPASTQSDIESGDTVVFGTEVFDSGHNFASSIFTAPVTGRYQMSVGVRADLMTASGNYKRVKLVTSNRNIEVMIDPETWDQTSAYYTFAFSALCDMDASDTAYVQWSQATGDETQDIDPGSWFSGHLI